MNSCIQVLPVNKPKNKTTMFRVRSFAATLHDLYTVTWLPRNKSRRGDIQGGPLNNRDHFQEVGWWGGRVGGRGRDVENNTASWTYAVCVYHPTISATHPGHYLPRTNIVSWRARWAASVCRHGYSAEFMLQSQPLFFLNHVPEAFKTLDNRPHCKTHL